MGPSPEQFAKIDLPILTITGHYDGDQPGALSYYREHLRYAPQAVRDRHYLIIGPWDHAGTRTPNAEVGGLTFGEASVLDLNDLHKEWYDWTMKGGPRPKFLEKKVSYYVVGPGAEDLEARRFPGVDRRRAPHPLSGLRAWLRRRPGRGRLPLRPPRRRQAGGGGRARPLRLRPARPPPGEAGAREPERQGLHRLAARRPQPVRPRARLPQRAVRRRRPRSRGR